jgi:hypothetical protein
MVETLQSNHKKMLLPFAINTDDSKGTVRIETEKSAIFCLSELNRDKGGGFLKKKPSEKTVFIDKVYYPFWFSSCENLNVIFDGLNISSHSIIYPTIPDVDAFKNDLNERFATRQIYSTFLTNHSGYFQEANGEKTITIDGLIVDLDFVKEFMDYLKEATTRNEVVDGVLISPAHDEEAIVKKIKGIADSHNQFKLTLEQLGETIKILNTKTQFFLAALNDEKTAIDRKYMGQVQKATLNLEIEKTKIDKAYSKKITEITEKFEQENVALNKVAIQQEKIINDINADIEHLEVEIKNAIINKDEQAESRLKEKRNELKKKIPEFVPVTKNLKLKIQELEENKNNELFRLRQENQTKIKEASGELVEIEATRDAEKKNCQTEMEKIEEFTSKITSDIDKFYKMIEETLRAFDSLGIRGESVPPLLVHMPFYLFCYTAAQSEKRFSYVAPSKVNNIDLGVRLKTLGRKKLTQLFQPLSQKTVYILNRFIELLNENVAFRHEITEAASKADLLKSRDDIALIQNGLNGLKEDGWISKDEYEAFTQTLTQI